jgi:hormonally upregulated Neu-associated kinase
MMCCTVQVMETENCYYLVMEYCGGGDLLERIYARKRLDEAETRRYIRQIVSAVEYMHKAGIIHRYVRQQL